MYKVKGMEDTDWTTGIAWTVLVFLVPLAIALVTFTMGSGAFFWGLLSALTIFGVLMPISLSLRFA